MKACEVVWSWIPCACPQPHRQKCSRVRDAPLADVRLPEEKRAGLQKRSLLTYSTVSPQWNAPSPKEKTIFNMQVEAIGEMQIQATMQIHFTTFTRTRMATSKKKKKKR